ncbi:hypothetical protein [Crocosphaera sp. Alani8]|uniref:hypothetical protein n=1 Tax=Crocosphaera sp. Alani8 TaxID=3038952 RepID=UPI00313E5D8C
MLETEQLTYSQIKRLLEEIEINFKSHFDDEEYELSELIEEQEALEEVLYNGNYLDASEE